MKFDIDGMCTPQYLNGKQFPLQKAIVFPHVTNARNLKVAYVENV
jgi:hypothetical protein